MSAYKKIIQDFLAESGLPCHAGSVPGIYQTRVDTEHATLVVIIEAAGDGIYSTQLTARCLLPVRCPGHLQSKMLSYINLVNIHHSFASMGLLLDDYVCYQVGVNLISLRPTREVFSSIFLGAVMGAARYAIGVNAILYGNLEPADAWQSAQDAPDPK